MKNLLIIAFITVFIASDVQAEKLETEQWTPSKAASIQKQAQLQKIESEKMFRHPELTEAERNKLFKDETGEGQIHHAEDRVINPKQTAVNQWVHDMRQQAKIKSIMNKEPMQDWVGQLMSPLMKSLKSTDHNHHFKKIKLTSNKSSHIIQAEVYVYDAQKQKFLHYSQIDKHGIIELPSENGLKVDLVVIPSGSEALQIMTGVNVSSTHSIQLKTHSPVQLNVMNPQGASYKESFRTVLSIDTDYGVFKQELGVKTNSEFINLAIKQNYHLEIIPHNTYAGTMVKNVNAGDQSIQVNLPESVEYLVNFSDPNNIIVDGCAFGMYAYPRKSIDSTELEHEALYNTDGILSGFKIIVPLYEAFDYNVWFWADNIQCELQYIESKLNWVRADQQSNELELKPRSIPNIIYQDSNGQELEYNGGHVYDLDNPPDNNYFIPTSITILNVLVGKTYAVNLYDDLPDDLPTNATFTAVAGEYDVIVNNIPVSPEVKLNIQIPEATKINALVEFYKNGSVIQAFEYTGSNEIRVQIPPDTYDVKVSGINAEWALNNDRYMMVMEPFTESKTITMAENQRIDFNLDLPTNGVDWTLPPYQSYWRYYHVTAKSSGKPIAVRVLGGWYDGIISDLTDLDLTIRAEGYSDTDVSVNLSPTFNQVDISALYTNPHRLTGTVKNADNQVMAGLEVYLYHENDVFSERVGITDANGQYNIPKIKNTMLYIPAPITGNSLRYYYDIEDINTDTTHDIVLEDLVFNEVVKTTEPQLLFGSGENTFDVVFLAESFTDVNETFTDSNNNGVWDGVYYFDYNNNGVWDNSSREPYQTYGEFVIDTSNGDGTDISINNEAFVDQNGDGYLSINDHEVFVQNAKDYIRALYGTRFIKETIDFDAYLLFTASNQVGMDILEADDITYFLEVDTNFGATLKLNRNLLNVDYSAANDYVNNYFPGNKLKVVMINQVKRMGRANSFIIANGGPFGSGPNSGTAGHEFGHNPGGLADEYSEFGGTSLAFMRPKTHQSRSVIPDQTTWLNLLPDDFDATTTLPHTFGHGMFAGGNYQAGGVFRSTQQSIMKSSSSSPRLNGASEPIFNKNMCINNKTIFDYYGYPPPSDDAIFVEGFEPFSGKIEDLCQLIVQ